MRMSHSTQVAVWALSLTLWAGDKPIEVKPGEAIPAKIIRSDHMGPFKADVPAVLPMVVISFQTQLTEKGSGLGSFLGGGKEYTLGGISPALMQKITDEAQEAIEAELTAAGWKVLPFDKIAELDVYKAWIKSPDHSVEEVKRQFFSAGKGASTLSAKEMERVFVGGKRPLVGNGMVLGGWTGGIALCKIGHAVGAKVILFRALVNFEQAGAGFGIFSGSEWHQKTGLQISYAEMQAYPPDASGSTPTRIATEAAIALPADWVKDIEKTSNGKKLMADPERYEQATVEAIRSVAKGFAALAKK